jgi:hypothetical protein
MVRIHVYTSTQETESIGTLGNNYIHIIFQPPSAQLRGFEILTAAPMFLKSELVALAALPALATFVNGFTIPDPTATISAGKVVGTSLPITNQPGNDRFAFAYLAVQFAQNPPLRFAPPSAVPPFKEPVLAHTIGHACPQQFIGV